MFDLDTDISETKNLAEQHPEQVKKMTDCFFEWHTEIKKDQKNYILLEDSEF